MELAAVPAALQLDVPAADTSQQSGFCGLRRDLFGSVLNDLGENAKELVHIDRLRSHRTRDEHHQGYGR